MNLKNTTVTLVIATFVVMATLTSPAQTWIQKLNNNNSLTSGTS